MGEYKNLSPEQVLDLIKQKDNEISSLQNEISNLKNQLDQVIAQNSSINDKLEKLLENKNVKNQNYAKYNDTRIISCNANKRFNGTLNQSISKVRRVENDSADNALSTENAFNILSVDDDNDVNDCDMPHCDDIHTQSNTNINNEQNSCVIDSTKKKTKFTKC